MTSLMPLMWNPLNPVSVCVRAYVRVCIYILDSEMGMRWRALQHASGCLVSCMYALRVSSTHVRTCASLMF